MNVNYIVDQNGNHSAVIIPIGEWDDLIAQLDGMRKKIEILSGLEEAVEEVVQIRSGEKEGKLFKTFLDEN